MNIVGVQEISRHVECVREIAAQARRAGKRSRALLRAWLREFGQPMHHASIGYRECEFECWIDTRMLRSLLRDGYRITVIEAARSLDGNLKKSTPSYDALDIAVPLIAEAI